MIRRLFSLSLLSFTLATALADAPALVRTPNGGQVPEVMLDARGVWHLANRGPVSWVELLRRASTRLGYDAESVEGVPARSLRLAARRPCFSALSSVNGKLMPVLDDALDRYAHAMKLSAHTLLGRAAG